MPTEKKLGSARMGDAIGANVNKTGRQCKPSAAQAYKSGVSTGGGMIDFPTGNMPEPCEAYFDMAAGKTDGRGRTGPR